MNFWLLGHVFLLKLFLKKVPTVVAFLVQNNAMPFVLGAKRYGVESEV